MNSFDKLPDFVITYLKKFSLPHWTISNDQKALFENIIVIPSLAEYNELPQCLNSLEQNDKALLDKTLIIVVVNNSESADGEVKSNNKKTIQFLESYKGKLNLSFIDAASKDKELPDKFAGVGLARKIGCDLALTKFDYSSDKKKIIFFLDADCTVSSDYLQKVTLAFNKKDLRSAVIEYEHKFVDDTPEAEAIICYEIFLRYHRLGLKFAESYYDYHTIGSTIVCDVESYIKAGGMNKRKAGEDYYFLEKLAKLKKIFTIPEPLVHPSSRKSWRVPFGTGQRITRHLRNEQNEYVAYNPESFSILKRWLRYFSDENTIYAKNILIDVGKIHPLLEDFLIANNFQKNWERILSNNTSTKEIQKQKIFWFDAFRTLKLIHYLRDNAFPNINLFDAVDELLKRMKINFQIKRNEDIPDIQIQKQYLVFLRNLLKEKFSDDN
ncbi:glycosyltransferase [Ignavibacterium album]|uniref:glycosyltransferase n=1 Tax=Ignavibacterium album TaxID=591197 RepID=UPI0035B7B1D3